MSTADVRAAVERKARTLDDAAALLSPAADSLLEELANLSHRSTVERFGKTMALYAPLYLSNECVCTCTYCGFSMGLPIKRRTLRIDEVVREARTLAARGIRNILLVSAEHPKHVNAPYVALCVRESKRIAPYVALEIAAADEETYREYVDAGCDGVVLYQETYDRAAYAGYHVGGPKKKYAWRLDAPERAARAGVQHLGIGALLGLADWRFEALSLVQHARWLERHCWRSQINVSLPRINRAEGGFVPAHPVNDRDFVHFLVFLRLALPSAGITLSTRETATMRDNLAPLGVTMMSAGSSSAPGGYGEPGQAGEQFELEDHRTPADVACGLRAMGYEPVFKDWEVMQARSQRDVLGSAAAS
ncbi:MAG: 2-iminoacetate synthase ThiH [Candidatus Eremiobacteraeota bacterium]|nr:2-iminoacetate synthase ThiH [Candidatus Eremiobacteraeota bacterium]MBV8365981.1 2-iminoacetate synthase ThiH [Candidatus Eremiobacteraeota bacterium]